MRIELKLTGLDEFDKNLQRLGNRAPTVISRALNRAATSARAQLTRDTAADMKPLKTSVVREAMKISNATPSRPIATITASSERIALPKFGARAARGRGRGVTWTMQGTRHTALHAFMATMGSGHIGVFERKGRPRLPIVEKRGPSVATVAAKYGAAGEARFGEMLRSRLAHEIEFELEKFNR
jgi:hypothetical protein